MAIRPRTDTPPTQNHGENPARLARAFSPPLRAELPLLKPKPSIPSAPGQSPPQVHWDQLQSRKLCVSLGVFAGVGAHGRLAIVGEIVDPGGPTDIADHDLRSQRRVELRLNCRLELVRVNKEWQA